MVSGEAAEHAMMRGSGGACHQLLTRQILGEMGRNRLCPISNPVPTAMYATTQHCVDIFSPGSTSPYSQNSESSKYCKEILENFCLDSRINKPKTPFVLK